MAFRIVPLSARLFDHLYGLSDNALLEHGAHACVADAPAGFPCRVSLRDATPGERLILVNHEHLPVDTPYRSRHAIFVIDGAREGMPIVDEVPAYLGSRLLSVRSFTATGMMLDADVCEGTDARPLFESLLASPSAAWLHVHTAQRGCYLARVERAARSERGR